MRFFCLGRHLVGILDCRAKFAKDSRNTANWIFRNNDHVDVCGCMWVYVGVATSGDVRVVEDHARLSERFGGTLPQTTHATKRQDGRERPSLAGINCS